MKLKGGLPTVAWILLGLLGVSAGMLSLGQRESVANPSALSYGPSGTRAFADVLRGLGLNVVVTTSSHPKLASEDVAVVFNVWDTEPG